MFRAHAPFVISTEHEEISPTDPAVPTPIITMITLFSVQNVKY